MGLGTAAWSPSISFYGVTATFAEGTVVVAFDPWSAVIAVVVYVVMQALQCDQAENLLAMRRGQNLWKTGAGAGDGPTQHLVLGEAPPRARQGSAKAA